MNKKTSSTHFKQKDPHALREKAKYSHPIPSREYILSFLQQLGRPINFRQLLKALEINAEEEEKALGYRLKAMIRDGQLMKDRRGRYCLISKLTLLAGRVSSHPEDGIATRESCRPPTRRQSGGSRRENADESSARKDRPLGKADLSCLCCRPLPVHREQPRCGR